VQYSPQKSEMSAKIDLTGLKFGRLEVLGDVGEHSRKHEIVWMCLCDCGNIAGVRTSHLKKGHTKSCGCLHRKHGYKTRRNPSRLWATWDGMKTRCSNPNTRDFQYWGGKGVSVCSEWKHDFVKFKNWAIHNDYKPGLAIDRINSEGNYCPENCRFVTRVENSRKAGERKGYLHRKALVREI